MDVFPDSENSISTTKNQNYLQTNKAKQASLLLPIKSNLLIYADDDCTHTE